MCENCYEEYYGAPTEITDNAVTAAALIRKLYEHAPTGGRLHIVVDDWNLSNENVAYCRDLVFSDIAQGQHSEQLATEYSLVTMLDTMPESERAVSLALADGFLRLHA